MPRPPKCRMVERLPSFTYFKPQGIPMSELSEVILTVEELEAVRLCDFEGLEHETCAEKMDVSRPTFHRIVVAARRKITGALINGLAIRIHGGNFRIHLSLLECQACGYQWEGALCPHNTKCPSCKSKNWQQYNEEKCIDKGGDQNE